MGLWRECFAQTKGSGLRGFSGRRWLSGVRGVLGGWCRGFHRVLRLLFIFRLFGVVDGVNGCGCSGGGSLEGGSRGFGDVGDLGGQGSQEAGGAQVALIKIGYWGRINDPGVSGVALGALAAGGMIGDIGGEVIVVTGAAVLEEA
jgi:hypothetical protein